MKDKLLAGLQFAAVFVALASTARATTTWYVNGVNGSDSNPCTSSTDACRTIGHAISRASSGDSIIVAAAAYHEHLTIGSNLKILGSGAATTSINGGGNGRVVTISNGSAHVTLSKFHIINGAAEYGGGVSNAGTLTIANCVVSGNLANGVANGGGIYNSGALTINDSTINSNQAKGHYGSSGGGIYSSGTLTINRITISGNRTYVISVGGGLYLSGTTMINNSTISGNTAGVGGGISTHGGTLAVTNSTFSGNSALNGGGINNGGTLSVTNSTFSGNTALDESGGGITNSGTLAVSNSTFSENSAKNGGGIYSPGHVVTTIQNSIVANSPSGGNCVGTMTSKGYNLSSDNTCDFSSAGDMNNTDPLLGPLQNNGGPTQTMALLPGSPAIDAGNPSGCTDSQGHLLKTDQRGMPRPNTEDTGGCDMGAYERQSD